jgi:hypothetical protein
MTPKVVPEVDCTLETFFVAQIENSLVDSHTSTKDCLSIQDCKYYNMGHTSFEEALDNQQLSLPQTVQEMNLGMILQYA